jgi:hypothetical protein
MELVRGNVREDWKCADVLWWCCEWGAGVELGEEGDGKGDIRDKMTWRTVEPTRARP